MKKTYKTPTMKVVQVQQTHMLCTSDVNFGSRNNDPDYDYIGGDSGSGYGYGVPD